jgi:hypothetical protein
VSHFGRAQGQRDAGPEGRVKTLRVGDRHHDPLDARASGLRRQFRPQQQRINVGLRPFAEILARDRRKTLRQVRFQPHGERDAVRLAQAQRQAQRRGQ